MVAERASAEDRSSMTRSEEVLAAPIPGVQVNARIVMSESTYVVRAVSI